MPLYPYQREAVDALMGYHWRGNPLIALPTGSGKSHVQSAFISETLQQWPAERFLLLTHSKELLAQNAAKLEGFDVGMYSAGLGRRELGRSITVAGIQSIHRRAHEVGPISLVIIDECHLVGKTDDTMYRKFLTDLRRFCPQFRAIGMSATPYRLDSGSLILGDNRIFTDIVYEASIKDLIAQGYLSPIRGVRTKSRIDTAGVKRSGGEFVLKDLAQVAGEHTDEALDEVEKLCTDRNSWLVFCVSVAHAEKVNASLLGRGIASAVVVGKTPKEERRQRILDFKEGRLRALVSVGVLTTGFDAPGVDVIICLRPTLSPGLWVQMCGRGTRRHKGKVDCLVLDFSDNTYTHGPIDMITCDGDGNVKPAPFRICEECGELIPPGQKKCPACGAGFTKECPTCRSLVDRDAQVCPDCGAWFMTQREIKHNSRAAGGAMMSDQESIEEVDTWEMVTHIKERKLDSMKVTYWCGLRDFDQWVCFEHGGFATQRAVEWWYAHGGKTPAPKVTAEAIFRCDELKCPESIEVKKDGKRWWVV